MHTFTHCQKYTDKIDWIIQLSPVAQLVEQSAVNRLVASSSLAGGASKGPHTFMYGGLFYWICHMSDVFYVYVLRSKTTGKHYTGQTSNLQRRMIQHNNSHFPTSFTARNPGPWILIHFEQFATRKEAIRRERWLKSGVGRQWLAVSISGGSQAG